MMTTNRFLPYKEENDFGFRKNSCPKYSNRIVFDPSNEIISKSSRSHLIICHFNDIPIKIIWKLSLKWWYKWCIYFA